MVAETTNTVAASVPPDEAVSALADGELRGTDLAAAVAQATGTGAARDRWAAYHAAGEVLRTGAAAPSRLAPGFSDRVMARIAAETPPRPVRVAPVQPAPARQPAANDAWWKRVAGLASVVVVAGAAWMAFGAGVPAGGGATLAQQGGAQAVPGGGAVLPASTDSVAGMSIAPAAAPQVMLRDPRLDEFLRSQRQAQAPGATPFVRNANFDGQRR